MNRLKRILQWCRSHKVKTTLMVLLVAGAIFVACRWRVWFYNPPELPYHVTDEPQWVLLTFGDGKENSRNVSWMCGETVKPSLLYLVNADRNDTLRIKATGEVFESRSGKAAYYHAKLNDLTDGCHYRYRVCTGKKYSDWYDFQTYPARRDRFSFLYVGDVQDTINGHANKILRTALNRHPECEFFVCGGDLTERPTHQYWQETFRTLDSIAPYMPVMNVTGNHDYLKGIICKLERRFPLIFSYFLDSKVGDNMVYTTRYGNAQFFLLDSNREFFYLFSQRSWLKDQLKASNAKWKIVVAHHPFYSVKSNNWLQKWILNGLIKDYDVDLVLQGHEHTYARRSMHDDNGNATTPLYIISHCSNKNYKIEPDDDFDKQGFNSRYYQVIDINGDTLTINTFDANTQRLFDTYSIKK